MCGLWNQDDFHDQSQYLVLDDLNIEYFPHWKPFLGAQLQFTFTDRYRPKRTVRNWGKPTIWLCNEGYGPTDGPKLSAADKEYIDSNCITVDIGDKSLIKYN